MSALLKLKQPFRQVLTSHSNCNCKTDRDKTGKLHLCTHTHTHTHTHTLLFLFAIQISDTVITLGRFIRPSRSPPSLSPHSLAPPPLLLLLLSSFVFFFPVFSVTSSLLPLSKAPVSALSLSPAVLITQSEHTAYLPPISPSPCPPQAPGQPRGKPITTTVHTIIANNRHGL